MAKYMCSKGWKKNSTNTQGSAFSVEVLGIQWSGSCQHILSRAKDKLLHHASPTTKKETQHLASFCRFQRQHVLYTGILLWPMYWVTWKDASFEWGKQLCSTSRLQCKQYLHYWRYKCWEKMQLEFIASPSGRITSAGSWSSAGKSCY